MVITVTPQGGGGGQGGVTGLSLYTYVYIYYIYIKTFFQINGEALWKVIVRVFSRAICRVALSRFAPRRAVCV